MSRLKYVVAAAMLHTHFAQAALPEPSTLDAYETMLNFSVVEPVAPATPNQASCVVKPSDLPYTDEHYGMIDGFFARYDAWLSKDNRDVTDEAINFFGGRVHDEQDDRAYTILINTHALHEEYIPGTPGSIEALKKDSAAIIDMYLNHADSMAYLYAKIEDSVLEADAPQSEKDSFARSKLRTIFAHDLYIKDFAEGMMALMEERAEYTAAACSQPAVKNVQPVMAPQ